MARARSDKLLVHAAGSSWDWLRLGRGGQVRDSGQCDPAAADWPQESAATVFIDAGLCMGLTLDLPPLRGQKLQQAARWAAEEHFAGSAEDEHVVVGPRTEDGRLNCLGIAVRVMDELVEKLGTLAVERMLPDALCLPWQPGELALAESGGRILMRWGDWSFTALDAELAAELIDTVAPPDSEWIWHGGQRPDWLDQSRLAQVRKGQPLLAVLGQGAEAARVNLLSGPWAPETAAIARRQWRRVAVLAGVVVCLLLASAAVENYRLARHSQRLADDVEHQFRKVFPDISRIVRPRAQAERELARLRFGQAAGLLDLLHQAAPVIDGQKALKLDRVDYRNDELELALRAPDVAALEQLEQRLRALGLNADVQGASLDQDGASGRIRIRRGGGA